jgi:outer membrane protein assembly factor BamB
MGNEQQKESDYNDANTVGLLSPRERLLDTDDTPLKNVPSLSVQTNIVVEFSDELIPMVTKAEDEATLCVLQPVKTVEQFKVVWKTKLEKPNFALFNDKYNVYGSKIIVDQDGNLFVGYGNYLYSFILSTGALRWRVESKSSDTFEDMILFGDNHYIVSWKTTIVAYSKSGTEIWEKKVDGDGSRFKVLSTMVLADGILYVHNTTTLFALNPFSDNDTVLWKFPTHEFKYICSVCTRSVMLYSANIKCLHILSRGKFVTVSVAGGKDSSKLKIIRDPVLLDSFVSGLYPKLLRVKRPEKREVVICFADQNIFCHDDRTHNFMWSKALSATKPPFMYCVAVDGDIMITGFQGFIDLTDISTLQTTRLVLKKFGEDQEWDIVKNGTISFMIKDKKLIVGCEGYIYIIDYVDIVSPLILSKMDFTHLFGNAMFAFSSVEFGEDAEWSQENRFLVQ